jgi:hypothetical protein
LPVTLWPLEEEGVLDEAVGLLKESRLGQTRCFRPSVM